MTASGDEKVMSIWGHLEELRGVLIRSAIFLGIGIGVVAVFAHPIFDLLLQPLYRVRPDTQLSTFSPPEIFIIYLKITFLGGLVLSSPFVLWQLASFVLPGLTPTERKMTLPAGVFGVMCFAAGVLFAYFVVLPLALRFFLEFNESWNLQQQWRASYYLGFSITICVVFGAAFEMPLVVTILARLGIASPAFLSQKRKYAIVIIVAAAALLTPPDVVTQLLLAGPLWLLYELSIWLAWMVYPGDPL